MPRNGSRRSYGSRVPNSASNRKFVWARQNGQVAVDSDQGITIDLLSNFQQAYGADILGSTVMRVRGTVFWNSGDVTLTAISAVVGIRVADQTELQADAEGPISSMHADWMAYQTTILDSGSDTYYQADRLGIDVRSSRKMEELGQTLALSFGTDAAAGGTALTAKYILSVGLKLP